MTFGQRRARIVALGIVPPVALASSQRRAVLSMDELMAKYRRKPSGLPRPLTDEETPVLPPTPAMLRAAYESDRREASVSRQDDDHTDTVTRLDSADMINRALALHE